MSFACSNMSVLFTIPQLASFFTNIKQELIIFNTRKRRNLTPFCFLSWIVLIVAAFIIGFFQDNMSQASNNELLAHSIVQDAWAQAHKVKCFVTKQLRLFNYALLIYAIRNMMKNTMLLQK